MSPTFNTRLESLVFFPSAQPHQQHNMSNHSTSSQIAWLAGLNPHFDSPHWGAQVPAQDVHHRHHRWLMLVSTLSA
ncbi:hypothetical protein CcaverHIS002_0203550 [Cutaneotrichosporon cavernicola]|nr:hypothetical protein CcaverHIS002_0203550 [Cutaneotrichosporon cavernicola]